MAYQAQITIRTLAKNDGYDIPPPHLNDTRLERWIAEIADTPFCEFTLDDLTTACAQGIYPDLIVPLCLDQLARDPLAGEFYDGALIMAMNNLPTEFWQTHPTEVTRLLLVADRARQMIEDSDMKLGISRLIDRAKTPPPPR